MIVALEFLCSGMISTTTTTTTPVKTILPTTTTTTRDEKGKGPLKRHRLTLSSGSQGASSSCGSGMDTNGRGMSYRGTSSSGGRGSAMGSSSSSSDRKGTSSSEKRHQEGGGKRHHEQEEVEDDEEEGRRGGEEGQGEADVMDDFLSLDEVLAHPRFESARVILHEQQFSTRGLATLLHARVSGILRLSGMSMKKKVEGEEEVTIGMGIASEIYCEFNRRGYIVGAQELAKAKGKALAEAFLKKKG